MQCPSCGAFSENPDSCNCSAEKVPGIDDLTADLPSEAQMNPAGEVPPEQQSKKSTLIEFPGVSRSNLPDWRKELSERVREVQERRAREAAREAAEVERQRLADASSPPQLELLPPTEVPAMNPLVAAALKRIERAHQTSTVENQTRTTLATAVAYAPTREDDETIGEIASSAAQLTFETEINGEDPTPPLEKSHGLVVVPTNEPAARPEPPKVPRRLIIDDLNDPALNYLDSISRSVCLDEIASNKAPAFRRLICAVLDLIICGLLSSPIALAIRLTGNTFEDRHAVIVLAGSVVVVTFVYLTLTIALTGRTWAMRLLSLRVIDTKTGLIPTGSQSLGRSFFYLFSLATAGIGILFALFSHEGYTVHDRFTRTAVIAT